MGDVQVSTPSSDQITNALQPFIDAALSVAIDAPRIIKDKAILDNEDVQGQQMAMKQPRPRKNPQNFPNLALVQTGNLMDNDRWIIGEIDGTERTITYNPPDYLQYLLEKDPDHGGRRWILPDGTINPSALAEIEAEMAQRISDALAE